MVIHIVFAIFNHVPHGPLSEDPGGLEILFKSYWKLMLAGIAVLVFGKFIKERPPAAAPSMPRPLPTRDGRMASGGAGERKTGKLI